ncbi:MAG TPA: hypothetical protein VGG91_13890 [Myxococcaceae bacterium]|jgi:hypothetical protein
MPLQLHCAAEAVMYLGAPDLAGHLMGAADGLLAKLPIHYWASDQKPLERFRQAIAKQIPPERLASLRQEGARLSLEEAILRLFGFSPSIERP